jgi:hypothetical protein
MKRSIVSRCARALCAAALLLAATLPGAARAGLLAPIDEAAQYCRSSGGVVELRQAYYGTNNPNPLPLAGKADFCRFQSADKSSRIYVLTSTLYATAPTLAALAYYSKTPLGTGCNGNPASCYCTLLGGTDLFGGINAAGGAWVLKGSVDEDLDTCIFPDLSSIDAWGLAYHSAGIIRGKDLAKVLRYHNPKA